MQDGQYGGGMVGGVPPVGQAPQMGPMPQPVGSMGQQMGQAPQQMGQPMPMGSVPPAGQMPPQMMGQAPTLVPPKAGKKKTGLIIGIAAAAVVVVGGVLLFVLVLLPNFGGAALSCTQERTAFGVVLNEKYDFKFNGGAMSTMDYRAVMTADTESTIYSKTIDEIFDTYGDGYIEDGLSKMSLKKVGDSVVAEAKNLTKSEFYDYAGVSIVSIGDVGRADLKALLEDDGLTCQ